MKTKYCLLLALGVLLMLSAADKAFAGACTCARFHDWQDCGCNQNYPGAGGPPAPKSCNDCGMPRWWIDEPYVNLHISDTPLSYKTSSGKDLNFQFFYRTRAQTPLSDESAITALTSGLDNYPFGATCGTNALWSHNWNMSVLIQPTGNSVTPAYSQGYSALLFRADGGIESYKNLPGTHNYAVNPSSQATLEDVSGLGYPLVEETFNQTAFTNLPSADANGIYWGDLNVGVKLVYPDGSQDIFGLSCYPIFTESSLYQISGDPQTRLLLTQRIDPQGRTNNIGYEYVGFTNCWPINSLFFPVGTYTYQYYGYRVKYVVDSDGRTNTFQYAPMIHNNTPPPYPANNLFQVTEIDDPYGRKVQLGYDANSGILTDITDAAGLHSSFQYNAPITNVLYYYYPNPNNNPPTNVPSLNATSSGWITNLSTPYGNTSFNYYEVDDSSVTNGVQQRAIYVSEPTGAQQLFYYLHKGDSNGTPLLATTAQSPNNIPGVTNFDNGKVGVTHPTLDYRNTIYWGRRQCAVLSSNVLAALSSNMSNALANLTANDFRKGRIRNWLWQSDSLSISESLSSEREPSPDAAGQIEDTNRIWYSYPGQSPNTPEVVGTSPQIGCIATMLPDGSSQFNTYNYYPQSPLIAGDGLVSDNETSYSLPGVGIGEVTNWFTYAANSIDLLSISNSAGWYENYGYNSSHQVVAITNALGQVATLSWNPNLTGIQLPSGKSINFGYYASATPPTSTSSMLKWTTVQPEGRCFTNNSYYTGLPTSVTDDRGVTVQNSYDGLNRLTGTVFPDGTTISNIYNRLDLSASLDRMTNWTHFAYDDLQHLTGVTNANNAVTTYNYCGCGSLDQIVDALTNYTSLNYDNQGNLTNVNFSDNSSLNWQYDLDRRVTEIFDGAGRYVQFSHNNQGLPITFTSANGTLKSILYDALNRPISITDANGITMTNQYDAVNELLNRTWPDGNGEGFIYSTNGLIAYTNRDGQVTHYARDRAGRLLAVTNANHEVIQFAYDSLDNVTSLVDGNTNQTRWQYNQYGWLTNKLDGLGRTNFIYAYNANGLVTNRWTPEKGNAGYTYDNVGNLKSIAYPQLTIVYSYDALNRLTNMVDAVGTSAFTYTPVGQFASESNAWATINCSYTQGLRTLLTISHAGTNWTQSYGYDAVSRLQALTTPAGSFGYRYNFQPASGLVTGISLPNGANIANSYDSLARLDQTSLNNFWGHTLDSYSYTPDLLGLRTNIVRNLGLTTNKVNVIFDKIGQLTSWSAEEATGVPRQNEQLGLGYDPAHNLHTRINGGLSQTFTTDAANQLNSVGRTGGFTLDGAMPVPTTGITVNGQAAQVYGDFTFACTNLTLSNGNNTFTIVATNLYAAIANSTVALNLPQSVSLGNDNNGNLTNDGALSFAYDCENQLTNVTLAGNWRSDFIYDGLNRRRIERDYTWVSGAWSKTNEIDFVYDGLLLVQERTTNGNVIVTYTRGSDQSGSLSSAGGIGGLLARTDANGTTYYHADGSGNITALMDGTENIVARYLYGPSGKLLGQWGSMANANEMQFSSMQRHSYSGLSLYTFRAYDPNLQRWLNHDPIEERGGINLYQFVANSPVNFVDSDGREILDYHQAPNGEWTASSPAPNAGPGLGYIAMAGGVGLAGTELAAELGIENAILAAGMALDQLLQHNKPNDCPSQAASGNQPMIGGLKQIPKGLENKFDIHNFKDSVLGGTGNGKSFNVSVDEDNGSVWLTPVNKGGGENVNSFYDSLKSAMDDFPLSGE